MPDELSELAEGARNAVETCMGVTPADRVWVVSDEATRPIGAALAAAAEQAGATAALVLLESFGARPITAPPERFVAAAREFRPTVTFFAGQSRPGEVAFRMGLREVFREFQSRHGHMPGVDLRCMREGMRADYHEVARVTLRVFERVRGARRIEAGNADGSHLVVTCDPEQRRWAPFEGLYHAPGRWGNLPEGETFTAPVDVEGVLVSYVVGDYFSAKYGLLRRPVVVPIRAGHAQAVECDDPALQAELWEYLHQDPLGTRAGEFAIGTNIALSALTGNLLQDEKIPGVHLAFGNPYPHLTNADWSARTHVDLVAPGGRILVDGEPIMEDGRFRPELLA
jgi:leucyl aminopeptidase (aminopeptidase T)